MKVMGGRHGHTYIIALSKTMRNRLRATYSMLMRVKPRVFKLCEGYEPRRVTVLLLSDEA